ncbi:MFS transporter [Aggregatimonas sangjinii]|uniref:MFS transporter n=1 Tax=Aggregatimonas sangjinii TaxID=2583587 RepID=A0A5B7SXR9_9FLAO|nr:MFS transporter [Aggregatimonas sangjinii]QCX01530.1 MFS transporter [Aggregatimonas sangjinii]
MTLEIIVFVLAILFGIVWYWRESKSNKLYRLANRITHSKELQMKPDNKKGFLHEQNFLLRLVWITFFFVIASAIVTFLIPINLFFVQLFASGIVGTLIGTYVASAFIFTKERTSKEHLEEIYDKGKEYIEELTDGDANKTLNKKIETSEPEKVEKNPEEPKSARNRLKDKGMIK